MADNVTLFKIECGHRIYRMCDIYVNEIYILMVFSGKSFNTSNLKYYFLINHIYNHHHMINLREFILRGFDVSDLVYFANTYKYMSAFIYIHNIILIKLKENTSI